MGQKVKICSRLLYDVSVKSINCVCARTNKQFILIDTPNTENEIKWCEHAILWEFEVFEDCGNCIAMEQSGYISEWQNLLLTLTSYDVGVKRYFDPSDTELLRALHSRNSKNIRNPLIFLQKMASYSCFWRVPSSKILLQASLHRIYDLLTLVSSYLCLLGGLPAFVFVTYFHILQDLYSIFVQKHTPTLMTDPL